MAPTECVIDGILHVPRGQPFCWRPQTPQGLTTMILELREQLAAVTTRRAAQLNMEVIVAAGRLAGRDLADYQGPSNDDADMRAGIVLANAVMASYTVADMRAKGASLAKQSYLMHDAPAAAAADLR